LSDSTRPRLCGKRRNDLDARSSSINQSIWKFVYGSVRQWRTAEGLYDSSNGYCLLVYVQTFVGEQRSTTTFS
jgi:hypothetical protein